MPFDSTPERRSVSPHLDRMRQILSSPSKWVKGTYATHGRYCLLGALCRADGMQWMLQLMRLSSAGVSLHSTMEVVANRRHDSTVVDFNDAEKTHFRDIRVFLDAVEVELMEQAAIG
jgi:hypothetical protein